MKAVIQRVKKANVKIKGKIIAEINKGFLVLLAVKQEDTEKDIQWVADKILNLRVFSDEQEKMNLCILDIKGELLIVSQFTLYGDCKKGRRPNFVKAAAPEKAENFYNLFISEIKKSGLKTETGEFGAMMDIELINDGPVTIILES